MLTNRIQGVLLLLGVLIAPSSSIGAPDCKKNQKTCFEQSLSLIQEGDLAQAEKILNSLTRLYPEEGIFWFQLGYVRFTQGKKGEAERAFTRAAKLSPDRSFYSRVYLYLIRGTGKGALWNEAQADPGKKEFFRTVESQWSQGRLEAARKAYEEKDYDRAVQLSSSAADAGVPEANLLKGITLLRRGDWRDAREPLRSVLSDTSNPQNVELARGLLRQIREGVWNYEVPLYALIEVRGGYKTNVFYEGESEEQQSSPIMQYRGEVFYDFARRNITVVRLLYRQFWEEVISLPQIRYFNHSLEAQLLLRPRNWFFQFTLGVRHDFLGSKTLQFTPSLGLRAQRNFGPFELGIQYVDSRNTLVNDQFEFLEGSFRSFRFYTGYLREKFYVRPFVAGVQNDTQDFEIPGFRIPLRYFGWGGGLDFFYYPLPKYEIFLGVSYLEKTYREKTIPFNETRRDKVLGSRVQVRYNMNRRWGWLLGGDLLLNHSSLDSNSIDDKNYTQWVFTGGGFWEFQP